MLEGQSKPFEEQFNSWYKKFLTEESSMNKEIKDAKDYKQKKLEQSRAEARATLKNYEADQREKLEREKDKINVEKNVFDKMDADFQKEVENMKCIIKCGVFVIGSKVCEPEEIIEMENNGFIVIPQ